MLDKKRQSSITVILELCKLIMSEQKGKELATVSVYLNTGIFLGIFSIGFVLASLVFAAITLILR